MVQHSIIVNNIECYMFTVEPHAFWLPWIAISAVWNQCHGNV